MRILCGYTSGTDARRDLLGLSSDEPRFRSETRQALAEFAPQAELVNMAGDLFNYWNALTERWTGEQDLVVIEQDIVISPDVIPTFESCEHDWCSFSYESMHFGSSPPTMVRTAGALGCTKFSADLQRRFPLSRMAIRVSWESIDVIIGSHLQFNQVPLGIHGDVIHLHDYSDEVNA